MIVANVRNISIEHIKNELIKKKYFCRQRKTFSGKNFLNIRKSGIKAILFKNEDNNYELKFVIPGYWKILCTILIIPVFFLLLQSNIFLMSLLSILFFSFFLFLYEPIFMSRKKKLKFLLQEILNGNIFDIEKV